jgi:hypothetical protein
VAIDEHTQHVALPKLMGQPAYARPPRHASATIVRPLDPDDLPLEIYLDGDELEHARELRSRPFVAVPVVDSAAQVTSQTATKSGGFGRSLTSLFRGSGART